MSLQHESLEASQEFDARASLDDILHTVGHGYLGVMAADGWPRVFPLNFVHVGDLVYFHGSPTGEKMEAIASDPRVSFTVVDAASLIPSYLRHPRNACPATQYYRSVMIRGRAQVVEDAHEKARALQALMKKLQPEGGHEPIAADSALYEKALRATAVVSIAMESMTGKFKFGQNLTDKIRTQVSEGLRARGAPEDSSTVERMLEWSTHPMDVRP